MQRVTPSQRADGPIRKSKSKRFSLGLKYIAARLTNRTRGQREPRQFGYDGVFLIPRKEDEMTISVTNSFKTRDKLNVGAQAFDVQRLEILEKQGVGHVTKLPFSLRILLENLLRCEDGRFVHAQDIQALASW